jgi:hypothetical protein
VAVLGGEFEIHDTGTEPGQYDVEIKTRLGVAVALEVTSFGGDDWKRTAARVRKQVERGNFTGKGLHHQWWVIFPPGIGLREIEEPLTEVLLRLEHEGKGWATKRYQGDDTTLTEVAEILSGLPVNSVSVFDPDPSPHEPRILLSQSDSSIGSAGALPAALAAVFQKGDNQQKLAGAQADERHLYVFMEDNGASAVLEGAWPLPEGAVVDYLAEVRITAVWQGVESPLFTGVVVAATPVDDGITVECRGATALMEELFPPFAPSNLGAADVIHLVTRSAGFPDDRLQIEGLDKLPRELFEVAVEAKARPEQCARPNHGANL